MAVPLVGFFVAFSFPVYLNVYCAQELDGFRAAKIGTVDQSGHVVGDITNEQNIPEKRAASHVDEV